MKFKVLDLFSGIGGFSLGLERTGGFETVAFCEIDSFCRKVLRKHWPDVRIHKDICKLKSESYKNVDVICGGFPCQDISLSNIDAQGLEGARSGLWYEYLRLIREIRPKYVIVENVAALLIRGLSSVLGGLAESGYAAEWECLPAAAFGAPHVRDRLWIIAYPGSVLFPQEHIFSICRRLHSRIRESDRSIAYSVAGLPDRTDPEKLLETYLPPTMDRTGSRRWSEPAIHRMDDGLPEELDENRLRIGALGNAVIPQIPEWIGYRILEHARKVK